MPRTEEENQKLRDLQRKKILNAAKDTFLRKGATTTMSDIAAEAGVSQGLAYRYFESKHAICIEVMREMSSEDIFGVAQVQSLEKSPAEKLEIVISHLLKCFETFEITIQAASELESPKQHFDFFHSVYHQMKQGSKEEQEIASRFEQQFLSLRSYIKELIEAGQEAGEFIQEHPDKLTIMVFTSIKGLTALAIRHPERFAEHYPYTHLILRMLKV